MNLLRYMPLFLCFSAAAEAQSSQYPLAVIRLPESVQTVFVAETSSASFHQFERDSDSLRHVGKRYMSIGQAGDGKEREGDGRTPLGIYFPTEQLDTSRLHEKYGVTAFPLDYPNAWDRRLQRSGDGIWVHGVDRNGGKRPQLDTDGCIALPNEDLAAIEERFSLHATPVIVVRDVAWGNRSDVHAVRQELEALIARWSSSLSEGDMLTYLSLYSDDFLHWGMGKPEWSAFAMQTTAKQALQASLISDLMLLRYPQEEGVFLSRFTQTSVEAGRNSSSIKRLYWRRDADGQLRIVAEDNG